MFVRRIIGPLLVLILAIAMTMSWESIVAALAIAPYTSIVGYGRMALQAFAWFAAALLLIRILNVAIWQGLVRRRSGAPVPRLLIDLVAGVIWVVTAIAVVAHVFALPMTGIATTSSVAIAIIGFAARDMIASLFSGIAINFEHPYQIGDWIEVEPDTVGKVLEISWLTTRTVTREGIGIIVPNARLATAPFRNFNHPRASWRDSVTIMLDPLIPAERVERILLAAMNTVPEVAALSNEPDVKIASIDERGVSWHARFWVSDYGAMPDIRYAVQKSILKHLHHAGIALAHPKRDLFVARMSEHQSDQRDRLKLILKRNELFADLTDSELDQIAQKAQVVLCSSGSAIVHEGEAGASLFVVVEGLLHVSMSTSSGDRQFDKLTPGTVFGEFSLLTGEPRSATVVPHGDALVFEIDKSVIAPILKERVELARRLSCILADRQAQHRIVERELQQNTDMHGKPVNSKIWFERLQAFFGLS
ncbi:MAG: cyclic nucleotide-binding domain-containing protein [Geminicoccaceae bacterium]